jgi:hypothetical protein
MRDAAQQPGSLARALEEARRRITELEAQLAEAQGQAPVVTVAGVPPVLVHALANAPGDGQVVRLGRGVIAVVGPGGSPGEVWDAITTASAPADPGPARRAAAGTPGAVRVFARALPAGLLALSVPDDSDGRDLILSAALPPGHRRRTLRMAHRASRLRPATVVAVAAGVVRFARRALGISRAHAGHAALAGASLTAVVAGAAFVLMPATSPAPSGTHGPPAAAVRHHRHARRFHQPPAAVRRRRDREGTQSDEPSPSPLPADTPSPSPPPPGLVPSVLAPVTSPVKSVLSSPLVSVSASPPASGQPGGVCLGVLVLGVCVAL